jgi:hypothetical protein
MRVLKPLITRWGETIDKHCPLNDYPRPQLRRNNWRCLNGLWRYAIRSGQSFREPDPENFDGEILVPFSPESLLSGVNRQLLPGETLWYQREAEFDALEQGKRLLLHFGAVDQKCEVFINGTSVGSHEGGYWPFCFDITELARSGRNVISVAVWDNSDTGTEAYGKQTLRDGGIWYTAQSGIWQTVWTETVAEQYIKNIKITPRCERSEVELDLQFSLPDPPAVRVCVYDSERIVSEGCFEKNVFRLQLPGFHPWNPDDPFLYTLRLSVGNDEVESYFGMRQFGVVHGNDGLPRLALNGKAIFHSGLLDQGYWSDGMYTAPSDEAIVWELSEIKKLGFNMLRKHIKIEPLRWYYHCDRLGLLVWQDFVSGGGPYSKLVSQYLPFAGIHLPDARGIRGFGRSNPQGRAVFERDMARTIKLLHNIASLSVWVPFNEGWGQFDAKRVTESLRSLDNTRPIDHASGWHDQGGGDFASHHIYYKTFRIKRDKKNRVQALTEFGGYSCPSAGHMATGKLFGYRMYRDTAALTKAFNQLYHREVIPAVSRGLSAAIYTQLSDVEDEINGLFTYDRAECKIEAGTVQAINRKLLAN